VTDIFADLDEMPAPRSASAANQAPEATRADRLRVTEERDGVHRERCKKCGGSGRFGTYRAVGQCFACKGVGFLAYKTDFATRAKARDNRANAQEKASRSWAEGHPQAWGWITSRATSFDFAASMAQAVLKYGALTPNQLAAVERMIAGDAARAEQRATEQAERAERAQAADIAHIETALRTAQGNGLANPKLRLAGFKFSIAPASGRNAGAVYVKGAAGEYLGKVQGGRLFTARECTPDAEAEILAVCADPEGSAVAYGKRLGKCACCGRALSDPESVARGIGPICAGNFGW
jgi:hypothetical protein